MATTPEQRARARAQRELATARREHRTVIPRNIVKAAEKGRRDYVEGVYNGTIPAPPKNSPEGRSLAKLASDARWGKADKKYEGAFKHYWYHLKVKDTAAQEEADADADALESPDEEDEEEE